MMQALSSYRIFLILGLIIIFVLALAASISMTGSIDAQESAQKNKIGVVDLRRILNEAQATKHIKKQVKAQRGKLEKEFGGLEKQLKKQKQNLIQEKEELNQQAFQKKQVQFQQKLEQTRSKAQTKRQRLKEAINNAMDVLRKNVKEVAVKLGKSDSYDLVISRQGAIYTADKHDMTDAVLSRLNDKITKINLEYSAEQ